MTLKAFLAAAVSVAALSGTAFAADLPRRSTAPVPYVAPVPVFTWTGFYAGLNAGYGWGQNTGAAKATFGSANGAQLGATAGYNMQMGQFVAGVEGDWDWNNASNSKAFAGPITTRSKTTSLLTLRGRAGVAMDRALIFATGGYAGGSIKRSVVDASGAAPATFASDDWHNGYAIGAGLEYAFTKNISAKAEYLYTNLSSKGATPTYPMRAGLSQNTVRGGVNYHF